MENRNREAENSQETPHNSSGEKVNNPFENGQTVDQEVEESADELEKEQQFKEAQTERD